MQYTLDFGKVDYNHSGRNNCRVTVDVRLDDGNLSICGNIWNPRETDIYSGGQNLAEIAKLLKANAKIQRVKAVWERWHLNNLHSECEHQRARGENWQTHPEAVCPDCGYKLGSAWLKEELPADVVKLVESQFGGAL